MLDREQSIESRSRLENLDEFMSVPKDYEENTPLEEQSLINFLTDLSLVADIDEADTQNGVTLMTMHSAKGLEFPIVFIMGMEESLFPHIRAIKVKMIMKWKRTSYLLCSNYTSRRVALYHKCNDQNVVWSFSIQYAISIFKRNPRRPT